MKKSQSEIKSDFFNFINLKCKLNEKEENSILNLNLLITNSFKPKEVDDQNDNYNNSKSAEGQQNDSNFHSDTYNKINETLNEIIHTKTTLNTLNNEINGSFSKLNSILNSRNTLSIILKDFNTSTKKILSDKEKMIKLIKSIDSIYKTYEQTLSFQAFLDNNDCIIKHRFISDYEEIEKGINFFTMNSNYTESAKYLQTYSTLKIISINKYYSFFSEGLSSDLIVSSQDEFFNEILKAIDSKNKDLFNYPKWYERMKLLTDFFERKSKDDNELKKTQDKLKQKFLEVRTMRMAPILHTIFQNINNSYYNNDNKTHFEQINFELSQIFLYVLANIQHYGLMFNFEFRKDVYILKLFTTPIFNTLYDTIRPIIVSLVSLEELIALFDAFSDNFGIFFIDIDNSNQNSNSNNSNSIPTYDTMPIDPEVINKIVHFLNNYFDSNYKSSNISKETIAKSSNITIIVRFLIISKHLIRPTILHLIQDIQEKIYFKINQHVKSNFISIETDFPSFGLYEQKLYSKYNHFSLFHFFLRRIVILFEIFKSKLDDKILTEIIVSSIETFISILNNEILNKKNLNYEFQIYIIQQILLCLHIVEEFKIETIELGIQFDFGFVTEMFKSNYESLVNGKFTISEVLANSAPKILDASKDFKKILYNNLFKSYKIFINLANDFIFKRSLMDLYHKIQNKASQSDIEKLLIEKRTEIIEIINSIEEKYKLIIKSFQYEIKLIDNEVYSKIEKVLIDNVMNVYSVIQKTALSFKEEAIGKDIINVFIKGLNIANVQIEFTKSLKNETELNEHNN